MSGRPLATVPARIVVADDEQNLSYLVRVILGNAGFQVVTGLNGVEALALVAEASTQLVVTDRMMPVMSGPVLVERLRSNPDTASIPILMLSSSPDPGSAVDAFMSKPFDPAELVKVVKRLITAATVAKGKTP